MYMTESKSESIWQNCLKIIKDNVPSQSYKTWFEPIKALKLENNILTIQVPSQFFYEWLEEHYVSLLRKTIKQELGNTGKLEYNIIVENNGVAPKTINLPTSNHHKAEPNEIPMPLNLGGIKNPFIIPGIKKQNIDPQLNPNYTFENYIEGDCNRLARSAGLLWLINPVVLLLTRL